MGLNAKSRLASVGLLSIFAIVENAVEVGGPLVFQKAYGPH